MALLRALLAEYGIVRILAVVVGVLAVAALIVVAAILIWPDRNAKVPNLSDLTLESAQRRHGSDFGISVGDRQTSEEPEGSIISQDPPAGERVKRGSAISVVVSAGNGVPTMEVPDLSDSTLDSAQSRYEDDFDISVGDRRTSEEPADSIISQDPPPGEKVKHGSPISVVLSTGEPTTIGTSTTGTTGTTAGTTSGTTVTTTGTTTVPTGTTTGSTPSSVVFEDDFSDDGSGWAKDDIGQYSDGGYVVSTGDRRFAWVTSPAGLFEDAIVEVDARDDTFGPTGSNYWGIACRMRGNRYYDFGISNKGEYLITKRFSDGNFEVLQSGDSSEAFDPKKTNHISARCVGSSLTLQVNGQTLLEATDTEFSSGEVGLYAEDYVPDPDTTIDAPGSVDVFFDNFKVSRP